VREKSIFFNLTKAKENATTELLCNLCGQENYRNIIINALGLNNLSIDFDHIQTQQTISGKKKIPDIIIENDKIKVFIENKIDRNYKLLKSQTQIYPEELKRSKKIKKLIYLIPKGYKYKEKIKKLGKEYDFISMVYWEYVINKLVEYNKEKKSEIIDESITFFNKILKMIPKTDFTKEDLSFMNNVENFRAEIKTMGKELELFSSVIGKLKENLSLGFSQKEPLLVCGDGDDNADAFGYYFCNESVFMGYSFEWLDYETADEKEYALSLAILKDSVNSKIKTFTPPPILKDGFYFFKIDQNILSDNDK
jgi:hypothetical protein